MAAQDLSPTLNRDNPLDLANLPVKGSAVGLSLPDDLKFEDWRDIGQRLGRASNNLQWLIGDWWRHGWHRYGSRVQQVDELGLSFQACEDCAWVCRQFETSRRREVLSFTHHREVAALEPARADELLDWCIRGGTVCHSTRELREESRRRENEILRSLVPPGKTQSFPCVRLEIVNTPITPEHLRLVREPEPEPVNLDTSAPGSVSPQLAALSLPPADAAWIAENALASVEFDKLREIIVARCRKLAPAERASIIAALSALPPGDK